MVGELEDIEPGPGRHCGVSADQVGLDTGHGRIAVQPARRRAIRTLVHDPVAAARLHRHHQNRRHRPPLTLDYSNDKDNRVTSQKQTSDAGVLATDYGYDGLGRLTDSNRSDGQNATYANDSTGDRTKTDMTDPVTGAILSTTATFNAADQLTKQVTTATLGSHTATVTASNTFDANGNLTTASTTKTSSESNLLTGILGGVLGTLFGLGGNATCAPPTTAEPASTQPSTPLAPTAWSTPPPTGVHQRSSRGRLDVFAKPPHGCRRRCRGCTAHRTQPRIAQQSRIRSANLDRARRPSAMTLNRYGPFAGEQPSATDES